jgi:hypothetical protein
VHGTQCLPFLKFLCTLPDYISCCTCCRPRQKCTCFGFNSTITILNYVYRLLGNTFCIREIVLLVWPSRGVNDFTDASSVAFTAVTIQVGAFWVVTPCNFVLGYQLLAATSLPSRFLLASSTAAHLHCRLASMPSLFPSLVS